MKKNKEKDNRWLLTAIVALFASVCVFAFLLMLEKNALKTHEYVGIPVASDNIPLGTVFDDENIYVLFTEMQVDKEIISAGMITDVTQLPGSESLIGIEKGMICYSSMLENVVPAKEEMKDPCLISASVQSLSQAAAGVIRPGDRVDIYITDDKNITILFMENVYVSDAFDISGNRIEKNDASQVARAFNFYMERDKVKQFLSIYDDENIRLIRRL